MDVLGIPTVLVPPNPGNVSAFGLLTVDVKNDYVQTHVALADALDPATVAAAYDELAGRAAAAHSPRRASPPEQHQFVRTADLRYFGQAFEVRVAVPDGAVDAAVLAEVADRFHAEHRALYGYDFSTDAHPAGRVGQPPGLRHRPDPAAGDPASRARGFRTGAGAPSSTTGGLPVVEELRSNGFETPGRAASASSADHGYVDTPVVQRTSLAPGQVVTGPVIIEEFGSTVPVHPGFQVRVDEYLNLIVTRSEA